MRKDDLEKLSKCLRMLASPQDGEVLSAARAITSIQSKNGIDLATDFDSFRNTIQQQQRDINIEKQRYSCLMSEHVDLKIELKNLKKKSLYERMFQWN